MAKTVTAAISAEVVRDNELAARAAIDRGDYVLAFLLVHALVESLFRTFLNDGRERVSFGDLVKRYAGALDTSLSGVTTFVDEFTQFNRRRNRIVHELWLRGYSCTNERAKDAALLAVTMYGLFIEFLQTYAPSLAEHGFEVSDQ